MPFWIGGCYTSRMLDHYIQRTIVYELAFTDSLRFGELQPDGIENKLFDYHLKKVVAAGLVKKTIDGRYTLTSEGRRIGKGALKNQKRLVDRAYSIILMAVRRKSDGAWLLYRRTNHPLIGLVGLMQAQPIATETVQQTARRACKDNTGLICDFSVHGHGYFKFFKADELESYIHFTLMVCDSVDGDINTGNSGYFWDSNPDSESSEMLPTMKALVAMCLDKPGGFIDQTINT